MMQEDKNLQDNQREGGDEALSASKENQQDNTSEDIGYSNEERIAEEGEGPSVPDEQEDDPAGSGIASKE